MLPESRCKACRAPITWVQLSSGKRMPVDIEAQPRALPKLVAVNHATGGGRVLSAADIDTLKVAGWLRAGCVTLHRSHLNDRSCPIYRARRTSGAGAPEVAAVTA